MEHPPSQALELYASGAGAVSDRRAVEAHLDACLVCRGIVEESRAFIGMLEDPETWEAATTDPAESAPDELRRFALRCAIEDREAVALLARYETLPPSQLAFDDLPSRPEFRTGGVVRLLCQWANQMCERNPLFALTLAETATAISALLRPALFPRNTVHELRGTAWKEQANALRFLGRLPEALKALDRAEAEYRQLPHEGIGLVAVDYVRAYVLFEQGDLSSAERLALRAKEGAAALDDTDRVMRACHLQGEILFERGSYEDAVRIFSDVLLAGKRQNDRLWVARESLTLGNCEIELAHLDAARLNLQRALTSFTELGLVTEVTRTRWAQARLSFREGLPTFAVSVLRQCVEEFGRQAMLTDAALVAVDLAEVLDALSRTSEIPRLLKGVVATFIRAGKLTGALTALGYLSAAATQGGMSPRIVAEVKRFIKRVDRRPQLQFVPPL